MFLYKPILNWLFASYTLIFTKTVLAGLNTLNTPTKLGIQELDEKWKNVCWVLWPECELKKSKYFDKQNV